LRRGLPVMIVAGLTGGIASGKSTVARFLEDAGAVIIDADTLAHEAIAAGSDAYHTIRAVFGAMIIGPDGEIDRKRLGEIVFNDPKRKAHLEAIVHPHVFRRMNDRIAAVAATVPNAVVILDIPLLFETGSSHDMDEIIVVYVPEALQRQRLIMRDGITESAATARIRSQMPIDEKRRRATVVIDNSGSLDDTRRQARAVFRRLARRADIGSDSV
jgi:dephospho-CoA kinase